jgi:hypothetical protein
VTAVTTVSDACALWAKLPDVPEKEIESKPAATVAATVKATCCWLPGAIVKVIGVAVTPVGKPVAVTSTLDEKPLELATLTDTFWLPPESTDKLVGVTEMEKSGGE